MTTMARDYFYYTPEELEPLLGDLEHYVEEMKELTLELNVLMDCELVFRYGNILPYWELGQYFFLCCKNRSIISCMYSKY